MVVQIQVGPSQVDRLETSKWLPRRDVHKRRQIEIALQAWIDASLK
jgi:hypothetical protein